MKLRRPLLIALVLATLGGVAAVVVRARRPAPLPAGVTTHRGALEITGLLALPRQTETGGTVALAAQIRRSASATGALEIEWRATKGRVEGRGVTATWRAPATPGRYEVAIQVKDGGARARRSIPLLVHLPSARTGKRSRRHLTEEQDLAMKEQRRVRTLARVRELREQITQKKYGSPAEYLTLLGELADALTKLGDHAGALEAYYLAISSQPLDSGSTRRYRRSYGEAALALGREDEALQAFLDAETANTGTTYYEAGDLLERRGRVDEALEAYLKATERDPWSTSDAAYRAALILLERGEQARAFQTVMNTSAVIGPAPVRERLTQDSSLAPLRAALEQSGKLAELPPARPIERQIPGPAEGYKPGDPALDIIPAQ